jgi:3'5'-cyclic nucleotide phosphodiesterase
MVSKEELKTFKKRMMGSILATDMAKHFDDLASFKRQLETSGIKKELANGSNFIDRKDAKTIF